MPRVNRVGAGQIRGRMLATQNLLNWIGIMLSSVIYQMGRGVVDRIRPGCPSLVFIVAAIIMGSVAVFYRPNDVDVANRDDKETVTL